MTGKCSSLCDNHYEEFNMKEDGKNMTREPALIHSFSNCKWPLFPLDRTFRNSQSFMGRSLTHVVGP